MRIPVAAALRCSDGPYGRVSHVIVEPATMRLTHLAAVEPGLWPVERLIPVGLIAQSMPSAIVLSCTREALERMIARAELGYGKNARPCLADDGAPDLRWSLGFPQETALAVPREVVPPGELAVHKYTRVLASDGPVGQVDELLTEPGSGTLTHVVLREGHLWGRLEVTVPAAEIARFGADAVRLRLTKRAIAALPAVPVRSWWH